VLSGLARGPLLEQAWAPLPLPGAGAAHPQQPAAFESGREEGKSKTDPARGARSARASVPRRRCIT
jgi:hypothetical protein